MAKFNQEMICAALLRLLLVVGLSGPGPGLAQTLPEFPPAVFATSDHGKIALGRLLFYDKILSGNRNIACATCHHPDFGTSDGVSLALGEGGIGLGPDRRADPDNLPEQRIGRNAPGLFNLGAQEFSSLFHDGRLEADASKPNAMRSPLAADMVQGFDSILAAQASFPVLSGDEMTGQYSENEVSKAVRQGLLAQQGGAWDLIAARVAGIPAYRVAFDGAIGPREIRFPDIANMIAAFIAFEWRADNSPFDRYLQGASLPAPATSGIGLFYGKAGCARCHAGRFQTDQQFHAIAMPQIGPGKAARFESHNRDMGRMRVTGQMADAYRFRTPSLRNLSRTAPYGHDGAYATLAAVVRHHLDPLRGLATYDATQAILPELKGADDLTILNNPDELAAIVAANELAPVSLNDAEFAALLAFLAALNDDSQPQGRLGVPDMVPSGLPVD